MAVPVRLHLLGGRERGDGLTPARVDDAPPVSIAKAALRCRCPRCGEGRLFDGLLTVRPRCDHCGLDLRAHDTGDGPAVFVIFIIGPILVGLAFWVEFRLSPPLWLHVILWPALAVPLAVLFMRPLKAGMVALQFRHRKSEMGS